MPRSLCFLLVLLSGPVLAFVSYCWFFSPQKFSDLSTHTKKQKQKQKNKKQTIAVLQMQRRMETVNEMDKYLQGKK